MSKGVELIVEERQRQIDEEGYTAELDERWVNGELSCAAACYALPQRQRDEHEGSMASIWPFAYACWRPTPGNRIIELKKAGALIAAEIDRLTALEDESKAT